MSKYTKIFAGLGVVAALGTAFLPLTSYAAKKVSGEVDLLVEIPSAISMTIAGNNDSATGYGAIDVYNPTTGDPAAVDSHSRSATPGTVDVTDTDLVTAATTSSSKATLTPDAVLNDSTFKSTIKVWTNAEGYTLNVKAKDHADLRTDSYDVTTNPKATIGASDETAKGTSAWNYIVTKDVSGTPTAQDAAAMTTGDVKIDELGKATSGGRETVVAYGVSTSADQPAGTYKTTLVYTATTK